MIQCPFCKYDLPDGSRFCGRCGRVIGETTYADEQQPTVVSESGLTLPPILREPPGTIGPDQEFANTVGGPGVEIPPTLSEPVDPNQTFEPTPGGSIDPNLGFVTLLGDSISPPHGNVPMVHGTPQVGGVPSVQGTPQTFGSSAGYDSPHQQQQPQPSHLQPQHPQQQGFHQQQQQPQPSQLRPDPHQQGFHHQQQQPQPSQLQPQHLQQPLHLRPHGSYQQAASAPAHHASVFTRASRLAQHGVRPSFLTTAITSAVLVTTIATVAVFFLPSLRNTILGHGQPPAALILNGSVVPGGLASIHGSNFSSGGTITITVDGHPAAIASSSSSNQASSDTQGLASFALGAYQAASEPSSGANVSVRSDGSFDATIRIDT